MRPFATAFALLLVLLAAASSAHAQADPALRRVVLTDGSVYVGTVADEAADPLVVVTTDGVTRTFARSRVAEITALIAGRFSRLDPTRSRLILTPTARTIGRGQARLSLLSYIVPNVAYGIADRVDVSATGFLTFGSGSGVLPVLGVKATVVDAPGVQAALGTSVVIPIGGTDGGFAALPFGVVTLGDDVRAVTFALGGALGGNSSGDIEFANGVVASVGGETQVSNSVKLLGEVVVPLGEGTRAFAVLPGVRFFGERFSIDVYGAVGAFDETDEFSGGSDEGFVFGGFAPFLNASYRF